MAKNRNYNEAVDKFMHLHLLKDSDSDKYKMTLMEITSLCQGAIKENSGDGDAHIMLANALYLAALPPLPGKYYVYFLPMAAAVISHWKEFRLNGRERANGEILYERIDEAIKGPVHYWMDAMPLESSDLNVFSKKYYSTTINQPIEYPTGAKLDLSNPIVDVFSNLQEPLRRLVDILLIGFFSKKLSSSSDAMQFLLPYANSVPNKPEFNKMAELAAKVSETEYRFAISEATVIFEKFQNKFGRVPVKQVEEEIFDLVTEMVYLFRRGKNVAEIQMTARSNNLPFRKFDQEMLNNLGEIIDGLVIFTKDRMFERQAFKFRK